MINMKLFLLILFCVSTHGAVLPENNPQLPILPDVQKICANDVNIDQCIRGAVSDIVNRLYSELSPLRVSMLDPLAAEGLRQAGRQNSPTRIYSNSQVTEVNIYFPKIVVEGTYQADMKFKGSNTITSGPFNVTMSMPTTSGQVPSVQSVLRNAFQSTGDFSFNLSPTTQQNEPNINPNQTPNIPKEASLPTSVNKPVAIDEPQMPVVSFLNNKPKQKPNRDFVKNPIQKKPIKPTTEMNMQSSRPPVIRQFTSSPQPNLNIESGTTVQFGSKFESQSNETPMAPVLTLSRPGIVEKPTEAVSTAAIPDLTEESVKMPATDTIPELIETPSIDVEINPETSVHPEEDILESSNVGPFSSGVSETNYSEMTPEIIEKPTTGSAPTFMEMPSVTVNLEQDELPIMQPVSDLATESDSQLDDTPFEEPIPLNDFVRPSIPAAAEANPDVTEKPKPRPTTTQPIISQPVFYLPNFVKPCDEDDPNFQRCIREAFWAILPPLYNDVQPFQIRRLDPLNIDRAKVNYDSGYFQLAVNFEDLISRGLNQADYRDIRIRISNDMIRADVSLLYPLITLEGHLSAELQNNGLKIPISGLFNVTMANVDMTQKWKGRLVNINEHKYLRIDEIEMIPAVDSPSFDLMDSLSDQPRNQLAATFLKENWPNIYKNFVRSTRSYWEPIMIVAANDFIGRIPFNMLTVQKTKPTSTELPPAEVQSIISEQALEPVLSGSGQVTAQEDVVIGERGPIKEVDINLNPTDESSYFLENAPAASEKPASPMSEDKPATTVESTLLNAPTPQEFVLPESVKPCRETDPNFNQCIQEAVGIIVPRLYNALKPLQSAQIDPLNIPAAKISYDTGSFEIGIGLENLATHGMSNAQFRDLQFRILKDTVRVEMNLFFPQISLDGDYAAKIHIKWLKVDPTGPFNVTMNNIDMKLNWKGHFVTRNGHKYLEIDEFDMIPEVGESHFDLTGISLDDPRIGIAVNFLNENWGDMYKLLVPETRGFWEPPMKTAFNQFLSGLPFDMLIVPEDKPGSVSDPVSQPDETSLVSEPQPIEEPLPPSNVVNQPVSMEEPSSSSSESLPEPTTLPERKPIEEVMPPAAPASLSEKPISTEEFVLPNNIQPCFEDALDYDQCVRMAVHQIFPQLYNQFKPFQTPRLDPLKVEYAHIDYDPGYVQVDISFDQISTYGMDNAELRDIGIRIYDDRVRAEMEFFYPKIIIQCVYNVKIKYEGLTFDNTGPANITMTDINMAQKWTGNLVPKNGHKYLKLDSIEMTPEIGSASFQLSDILDPLRKGIAIKFLNENWGILYKSFVPGTRSYWQPVMLDITNEFLEKLPFDLLTRSKKNLMSTEIPIEVNTPATPIDNTILTGNTERPIQIQTESTGQFIMPDLIQPCYESDANFNPCVREAVSNVLPMLFNEKNPFQAPQLNPLYTETATIEHNPTGSKKNITFEQFSTHGFNQSKLRDIQLRVFSESVQAEVEFFFPKLFMEGRYSAEIEYSGLRLTPTGPYNITMNDVEITQKWKGHFVTKNQHKYLQVDEIEMVPKIGSVVAKIEGVFDDQRSALVEAYLTRSWGSMYDNLIPATRFSWEPIMMNAINKFLERFPLDFIKTESTEQFITPIEAAVMNSNSPAQIDNTVLTGETDSSIEVQTDSTAQFIMPDLIQPCYESDANFNPCVREAVSNVLPMLFNEKNPFQAPQLNPLYTETATIEHNPTGSKKNITFEQFSTHGFNQSELRDIQLRVFSESVQAEVEFFFPKLFMEGRYSAEIEYSGLRLTPTGPYNITMNDVEMTQKWKGHFVMKNQHQYLQVDEIEMVPKIGSVVAKIEGVFDDQRSALVEAYLTRSWGSMYDNLIPATRFSWEPIMINAINKFLERFPFDFIKTESTEQFITPIEAAVMDSNSPAQIDNTILTGDTGRPIQTPTESAAQFIMPDLIQPCYESDPNFNPCVREAVSNVLPMLFNEKNPFQTPQLNPLYTETATIEHNPTGSKKNITFEQFSTHGFNQSELRDIQLRVFSESVQAEVELFFPKLFMEGRYSAEIEYSGLRLTPTGPYNITMNDVEMTQKWKGHFVMKNQHQYLQVDEIEMVPKIGSVVAKIEGVFDDQRSALVEAYLTRSWGSMYDNLIPATRFSWEPIMINAINKFLERFPFDFIKTESTEQFITPIEAAVMDSNSPAQIDNTILTGDTGRPIQTPTESAAQFIMPDLIQPCYESDPNFNPCVREAVSNVLPMLFNEKNPFQTPQLNPLYTETATIEHNPTGSKKNITFEQFSTHGFNQSELRDIQLRVFSESVQAEVELFFPKLFMEGRYSAEIEYSGLRLTPTGPYNITMNDVEMTQKWKGHFVMKNQHQYLQVDEIEMVPKIGSVVAKIEGVFDDQRSALVEAYLTRSWGSMYDNLIPATRFSWEPIMMNAINKFLERFPLDFIKTESTEQFITPIEAAVMDSNSPAQIDNTVLTGETDSSIEVQTDSTAQFIMPDLIQPCYESDANFNPCVREAVSNVLPMLFNEKNPFQAPQLNPLYTETATIEHNPTGSKKNITFEQFSTHGFNQSELRDIQLRVFSESVQAEVEFFFPKLFMEGRYSAEIEYSGLRLTPTGPYNITMNDVEMTQKWKGHFVMKNQHQYLQVDEIEMVPKIGSVVAKIEGVFDDQRSALVEAYLTRSWGSMYDNLIPATRFSWEPIMINAINKFLERLPLDFIKTEGELRSD